MQQLGVNVIRVYNLDTDLNHDACASIFNSAGIYMILDVNSGLTGQYIDRSDPSSTYTLAYLKHIFGIVEAFAQYPNTLGYFAANEIINEDSSYDAPLYIRAVVRDMKEYIANNLDRSLPVGYAAADVATMLQDTWNYLGCSLSNSTESKIDFFGLNDYEWCGDSSYTKSGYDNLVTMFGDTDIPVFFSEYGCNNVEPRTFTNVPVIYGDEMTVLSGGLVYEYSEESDDYGLVAINSSSEVTLLEDYAYLKQEFAKIVISDLTTANKTAEAASTTTCATSLITESAFYNAWGLPDRPSGGDSLVTSGLSSANVGSLVAVNTTTIPATVYNYTGATVTGLALVELACSDSNYPGLVDNYTSSSVSCSYASPTSSGSSASSTKKSSAASPVAVVQAWAVALAVLAVVVVAL